jgi:hypothetical protein
MKSGEWPPGDNQQPAEHTGLHALIAVALLVLVSMMGACGEEDFTVGGPLPTRPSVDATNPSATPDDN